MAYILGRCQSEKADWEQPVSLGKLIAVAASSCKLDLSDWTLSIWIVDLNNLIRRNHDGQKSRYRCATRFDH
jgi:hypothetical protein